MHTVPPIEMPLSSYTERWSRQFSRRREWNSVEGAIELVSNLNYDFHNGERGRRQNRVTNLITAMNNKTEASAATCQPYYRAQLKRDSSSRPSSWRFSLRQAGEPARRLPHLLIIRGIRRRNENSPARLNHFGTPPSPWIWPKRIRWRS
jgi:hypothetical protein